MLDIFSPSKPVRVALDVREASDKLLDELSCRGALVAGTMSAPSPTQRFYDDFYARTGTEPSHVIITSPKCDDEADGLTVYFCGEHELRKLDRLLQNNYDYTASNLVRLIK